MNKLLVLVACAVTTFAAGCAAESRDDAPSSSSELTKVGASDGVRCSVASKKTMLALVPTKSGKAALLSLEAKGDLYALSSSSGSLATSSKKITWTASGASLALGSDLTGTWESHGHSASVTCEKVSASEASSWRTASALTDYADEIQGIADAVLESSKDPAPKTYTVFAVETARRDSLALGTITASTSGKLSAKSSGDDTLLDEDDFSNGGMSAAYGLGGGDDYGEWFQGVSDGVSLIADVTPALGSTGVAGFIAREKVTALASVVDSKSPSAVEVTVGAWTFFLPDAFPR